MSDKYEKLKAALKDYDFPLVYPFKFIVAANKEKLIEIKRNFDETAEIDVRESRNGKYSSITIKQMMLSTEDIINHYKKLENIEGIISL
jgi:putative lipoic acid-binding regulatory protein